ncbi:hypothetical protein [Vibrio phage phiKT1019]|nr:hypothetical protein [Vibrio phage phiKT1019]
MDDYEGDPINWRAWFFGTTIMAICAALELYSVVFGFILGYVVRWWLDAITDSPTHEIKIKDEIKISITNSNIAMMSSLLIVTSFLLMGFQ